MTSRRSRYPRYVGLLLGSGLAGGLLWAGAMPANPLAASKLPTRVSFMASSGPFLSVGPANAFISDEQLTPSEQDGVTGSFPVHNLSEDQVTVRIRADVGHPTLDSLLHVSLEKDGDSIYSGSLAKLRTEGSETFQINEGGRSQVSLRTWLPRSADPAAYEGRVLRVPLKLDARGDPR